MTRIAATRDAWGYLMESVQQEAGADHTGSNTAQDKSAYYMSGGTPPGHWVGSGLTALGMTQDRVIVAHELQALFGAGKDPLTGDTLGQAFRVQQSLADRIDKRVAALSNTLDPALRDAAVRTIEDEETVRPSRDSVSGFEFVFSPPKSVSAWWALADPALKEQIRDAHHLAMTSTIMKLERDVARTRVGVDGVAQAEVTGVIAASFDHWDSREGDPQLHTHLLISNRVQGVDGVWRTLDSRYALSPAVATVSAYYDGMLMDALSQKLGVEWTLTEVSRNPEQYRDWLMHTQQPDSLSRRATFAMLQGTERKSLHWQIEGIPQELNDTFSTRSQQIKGKEQELVASYFAAHGVMPSMATLIRMRQAATLRTRRNKQHVSLRDLTRSWRTRAAAIVGDTFLFADRIARTGADRLAERNLWSFRHDDVTDAAVREAALCALADLAGSKSTWSRWNAETAASRVIAPWRFKDPTDRDAVIDRVTAAVLDNAIALTPANVLRTPYRFHTRDGQSQFHPETRDLFTTVEVWDAEERLLVAGETITPVVISGEKVQSIIFTPTGDAHRILSEDQAAAVTKIVTSGRLVDVLVGPAGAGKTTSLQKLRQIWESEYGQGSVRGLAPTARAAGVLAESLGILTENTAKWLYETGRERTVRGSAVRDGFSYQLNPGDLLIVDEASIAGTLALDLLRAQAEASGAKILLVGDWAQLAAVDAGGAFGLLAKNRDDVPELVHLHRFTHGWEADASKLLRLGKTAGLTAYIEAGRVAWGVSDALIPDVIDAWRQDESDHKTSLLIAPTNDMVTTLNDIARQWRVTAGLVDATQEATICGGVASAGDRIVTRQNDRQLTTDHDRWVKNNDEWVVSRVLAGGSIVATAGEESVILPAHYVTDHVQLAYATTAHRSQGRTVDTAHTIVDSTSSRENFYVAMTRGKESNRAYVIVDTVAPMEGHVSAGLERTWLEILEGVVTSASGDKAAHDTAVAEVERVSSVRQLAAEYRTIVASILEERYLPHLAKLGVLTHTSTDSAYVGPLLVNIHRLEELGADVTEVVRQASEGRELATARNPLAVLHYRVQEYLDQHPHLEEPARIVGLFRHGPRTGNTDIDLALIDREHALRLRAELLVDQAVADQAPWINDLEQIRVGAERAWRERAVTVAAYRDLYGVNTDDALGAEHALSASRTADRDLAARSLTARSLTARRLPQAANTTDAAVQTAVQPEQLRHAAPMPTMAPATPTGPSY